MIFVTRPAPTVRPPSRMAKRSCSSIAIGWISATVIEVVSPGNKDTRAAIQDFVEKTIDFLRAGVHVLIVDLYPPTLRDPQGIHRLIWDQIGERPFSDETKFAR